MALTLELVADPIFRARFLSALTEDANGCWIWQKCKNALGYGFVNVGGHRSTFIHRVFYAMFYGEVPPRGEPIDPLCRVPSCGNPWHLELVTHRENILRGQIARGVGIAVIACPAGHPYSPENTYVNGGKRFCRTCGNEMQRRYQARKRGGPDIRRWL